MQILPNSLSNLLSNQAASRGQFAQDLPRDVQNRAQSKNPFGLLGADENATVSPLDPIAANYRPGTRPGQGSADIGKDRQQRQAQQLNELMSRLAQRQEELNSLNLAARQQIKTSGDFSGGPSVSEISGKTSEIQELNAIIGNLQSSGTIGGLVGNQGDAGRMFSFEA